MNEIKAWWEQASSRDQMAIVACGAALAIYILYAAILKPVQASRDKHLQSKVSMTAMLAEVKTLSAQWTTHKRGGSSRSGGSISRKVEDSLRKNSLRFSGMDPIGSDGLRIRLDQANYNNVVAWLNDLEVVQGLQIKDMTLTASSDVGRVSVNLRVYKN